MLYVKKFVLTTQFHLGTYCQINIHYKCFKILSHQCVRSNTQAAMFLIAGNVNVESS